MKPHMNRCAHCELPIDASASFNHDGESFCCQGCVLVYDMIDEQADTPSEY